jgi:gliding motility-associated-like protein
VAAKAITPVGCGGANTGAVDLTVTGGTPGYTYLWNDGATTEDRSNVTAYNYHFTVTDANGCQMADSANVTQPMGMVPSVTVNDANCNASNGGIDLTVQYGYPPYSYMWNDGTTTEDRSSLMIGTYTVTITDNIACTVSVTATVNQANTPMNINHTATNVTCNGGNTGAINITSVVGAPGPFTFNWSNGATTQNISALTAGSYTVTVTSGNSCTATKSVSITQPVALTANTTATQPNCYAANNGAITTSAAGGNGGNTFSWNDGPTTQNRFGLADGTYTVTVTDSRGCTATSGKTIASPTQVVVNTTATQINCMGGSTGAITTSVSGGAGGYSYWWGAGFVSPNRSNLAAGTYNVTVTDATGCEGYATEVIYPYVPMTASHTQANNTCYGDSIGSINLTVNNGRAPFNYAWSNGTTTEDLSNLKADTYTVTVTDANGCTVSRNANITQPAFPIYLNGTVSDATCGGYNNGTITLSVSGGTSPYTFAWSDTSTAQNRTGLAAGNYSITLTDGISCQATATYTVNEPSAVSILTTGTDATCGGTATASINLNVFGGYAPYTYAWNDAATTQNRSNIIAGIYNVTVIDNHGCSSTATETVNQPAAINIATTVNNISCNGAATGSIQLNVSGGSGAFSYSWNDGATTQDRTGIAAGNYSVTLTDALSCTATTTATVTEPTAIAISSSTTATSCNGGGNGTITLTVNGGTTPYSFVWNDGAIVQNRTGLAAGSYTVTVIDNSLCQATSTITVGQPSAITLSTIKTSTTCTTMGAITLGVSGGTGAYSFVWNNGATTQSINNLSPGTYSVSVTDDNACTTSTTETLTGNVQLAITSVKQNLLCRADNTGSIDLTVTSSNGGNTFIWSNGATTEDITGLAAGNYTVTVQDNASCSVTAAISITQPAILGSGIYKTNVSCTANNDGSIIATPTGGTSPYAYTWNTGDTTSAIHNLTTGNYYLTVTDINNCTVAKSVVITQPSTLNFNETQQNLSCNGSNDGAVSVNITGGSGNYRYQWNQGTGTTQLSNLAASTYRLTVTDTISGCTAVKIFYVSQPDPLQTIATVSNATCNGNNNGSIALTPFGGTAPYQFVWSNGGNGASINNLIAGAYNVTITDINGCSITASSSVTEPAPLQPTILATNTCHEINNGTLAAAVTGGTGTYTYLWSNNDTTQHQQHLSAGTYALTVQDEANCQATTVGTISAYDAIAINETHNNVSCHGTATGAIQVSPQGGSGIYNFAWNNGSNLNLQNNLAAGAYTVVVTDNNSCTAQKTITISQPAAITLSETHTNYACSTTAGNVDLTVQGGLPPYFYRWNDNVNSEDRNSLAAGSYTVTVSDYNSCSATLPINITSAQPLVLNTVTTNPSCNGYTNGNITSIVTGGTLPYNYLWNDGSTNRDIDAIPAGTYAILVTDANNCSATQAIAVSQPDAMKASITVSDILCYGGTNGKAGIEVSNGTAPYTYLWNTNENTREIQNIPAGQYVVTVTDAANCTMAFTGIEVSQPEKIDIQASIIPSGCFTNSAYGQVDVTVNGGVAPFSYSWDNNATTQDISNLTTGNYFVAVTDANGCVATKVNNVPQSPAIDLTGIANNASCSQVDNGSIELNIAGGVPSFTIAWSNGETTERISGLAPGTYSVTVTDISHCSAETNFTLTTDYELSVTASANADALIYGQAAELTATTNVDHNNVYTWSSAEDVKCEACQTTTIKPQTTTAYTINVVDANGCTATDLVTIEVKDIKEIFIPNAFTPNNDANNDVFKVYGDMSTIALLDLKIFNRWGEKVYETNDIEFAWDGTYKGEYVDRGVYTYTLKIVYVNGVSNDLYKGSITVIR